MRAPMSVQQDGQGEGEGSITEARQSNWGGQMPGE
jgi:hypothetical protein